jgi:excinuclease ABC subunit C
MEIKRQVKELPTSCGVYIMKDAQGSVLYVGKAGNIKKRVSQYFYNKHIPSARTKLLLTKVTAIEHIPTTCEAEALILESSLIKRLKPKYNVALKDDKSYPYLKLTLDEEHPRLFITRRIKHDGSRYFGPYTNVRLLRQALAMIRHIFPLRTCTKLPKHVCLNYHLKQCLGPCEGKATQRTYDEAVRELTFFLEGKKDLLLKTLTKKMASCAAAMKFEEAAQARNRIEALGAAVTGKVVFTYKDMLEDLRRLLHLKSVPMRIEAFDVSNLYGDKAVGSMIAFYNMEFDKSAYRKFKIRTVQGIDDYKMMQEIVSRRYRRLLDEHLPLPDLVIIDGGKGHLSVAKRELDDLDLRQIPVIGIAKEFEHIYLIHQKDPIRLPRNSGVLHLIQRIRDEAHRFAISYHRRLRKGESSSSALDGITGIGVTRKKDLMRYFGDVAKIRKASTEDLLAVKSMNAKAAEAVVRYFNNV